MKQLAFMAIAVLALGALAACGTQSQNVPPLPTPPAAALATPVSEFPAAGACLPAQGDTATVSINPDVPSPRCIQVTDGQRLLVANNTGQPIEVQLGPYQAEIGPGQEHLFDAQLGTYLAPGVHRLILVGSAAPASGPEIWLNPAAVSTGEPSATATNAPPTAASLAGTQWKLVSFGPPAAQTPVVEGSSVTLQFRGEGQVGGNGGCNGFGGSYQVQGNTISIRDVVSTMMACADDRVTQQESQYFRALQAAGTYELEGDRLLIHYNNGQDVLTFSKAS